MSYLLAQMLAHCRARRLANAVSQPAAVPTAGNGTAITQAQRWTKNFLNLDITRRDVSLPSTIRAERVAKEAEDQACDLCTVRNELRRYKEEPPPPQADDVPLDLVRYWNVSFLVHAASALGVVLNQKRKDSEKFHPLIFKVALDVLPVQASAVSCEQIFSQRNETCVLQQGLRPGGMYEVLQVLKHLYDEEQLDFTSHWIADEDDYSI
jgi:hypothetical protein